MSVGPEGEGGPGPQPGSWPPPPGNTPQWQQPAPPPGGGWPPQPGQGGPGQGGFGPGGPGGPGSYGPQGPGGPGGPPPWGAPQPPPYGYGPPPPKKKGGAGIILGAVGAAVALIVVVVVVVAMAGGSGDDPKKTSGKAALKAGQNLGQSSGIAYTGTYGGSPANFSVTKAGTARGTYSSHGAQVNRVDIDGATYIKAASTYWTAQGQDSAEADKADGKWSKAPSTSTGLKLAELSPTKLSQALEGAGNDPLAQKTPVGSVSTIKMTIDDMTYYVSVSEPRRLVRIEGNTGGDSYSLDVSPVQAASMAPVFTQLKGDVEDLKEAYDPGITMMPMGKIKFGSCTESGCTVHGTTMASAIGSGTTGSVHVTMSARFWGSGSTVTKCSGTGTTTVSHETTITCRTSGGKWSSWYRSHSGRFTIHASSTFAATVNSSSDVSDLLSKLTQEQQGG